MAHKYFLFFGFLMGLILAPRNCATQENEPDIHIIVNMVQLNIAVTDNKGNYVTSLRPQDFAVTEDGISQKIATFGEGNEPTRRVAEVNPNGGLLDAPTDATRALSQDGPATGPLSTLSSLVAGSNVFVLFDTSNYMYKGFVFAQDAIADFVRSLENVDKVAFYSYSRDLSRSAALTADRSQVLHGVRSTVAGSSVVPPEDVAELAQSTGTAIYMISTQEAQLEPVSTAVFERMTAATGGKAYFAKNWRDERRAFASIRDDLAHLYSLSYYPQPNPNRGWRAITVKLVGEHQNKYHLRTRNGYRPLPARFSAGTTPPAEAQSGPN